MDAILLGEGVERWPRAALRPHPQAGLVPALAGAQLEALQADVERRGLLVPLEVTAAGVVLDGRARLRVAAALSLEQVPVRVVAPADEREHMLLAALRRQHLSPSQRAALALTLAEVQRVQAAARERRLANLRQSPEVAELPPRGEKTRELAARIGGVSPRTVQDAQTVLAGDPVMFERVKRGEIAVDHAARKVRRARRDAEIRPPRPLSQGPFALIYADPAWQLGTPDSVKAPERHYPTLDLGELKALRPPAAEDGVLFLWAVNKLLPEALELMGAWGFCYRTNLVWVKDRIGLGIWARNRHELLLCGVRGSFSPPEPDERPDSVIQAPRRKHSQKPECVYELLERAYPLASKLELFARATRPGWTAWGNQVPE
jgi:N6-adenosine-specific RNA methylase IME4